MLPERELEATIAERLRWDLDRASGPHQTWAQAPAQTRAAVWRRPQLRLLAVAATVAIGGSAAWFLLSGGSHRPPIAPVPTSSVDMPIVVLDLPSHRDLSSYPAALLTGTLVFDGSCVRVKDDRGGLHLPIWPESYSLKRVGADLRVYGPGDRYFTPIGDAIALGGGEYHEGAEYDFLRTLMDADVPAACRGGDYWLVSPPEIVTLATPVPRPAGDAIQVQSFGMFDRDHGWVLVEGGLAAVTDSGRALFVTSDGGATWSHRTWSLQHRDAPWFSDPELGWAIDTSTALDGTAVGVVSRSQDGGLTWTPVALPDDDGVPLAPVFLDGTTGYLMTSTGNFVGSNGPGGTLLKTVDRRRTWTHQADLPAGTSGALGRASRSKIPASRSSSCRTAPRRTDLPSRPSRNLPMRRPPTRPVSLVRAITTHLRHFTHVPANLH